jgi:hypothetical protein
MKQKNNSGSQGIDGTAAKHKGESQQSQQQGTTSVSKKGNARHTKDESGGARKNTTKKQGNSI